MSQFAELVNCVEWSLLNEPDKWRYDGFEVINDEMRCVIWVANHRYGLHLKIPGEKFGDVNAASVFFGALIPWRRRLYRAANRYRTDAYDPIKKFLATQYARAATKEEARS